MTNPVSESDSESDSESNLVGQRLIQYNIIDSLYMDQIYRLYSSSAHDSATNPDANEDAVSLYPSANPLSNLGFPERNQKPIINLCSENTTIELDSDSDSDSDS